MSFSGINAKFVKDNLDLYEQEAKIARDTKALDDEATQYVETYLTLYNIYFIWYQSDEKFLPKSIVPFKMRTKDEKDEEDPKKEHKKFDPYDPEDLVWNGRLATEEGDEDIKASWSYILDNVRSLLLLFTLKKGTMSNNKYWLKAQDGLYFCIPAFHEKGKHSILPHYFRNEIEELLKDANNRTILGKFLDSWNVEFEPKELMHSRGNHSDSLKDLDEKKKVAHDLNLVFKAMSIQPKGKGSHEKKHTPNLKGAKFFKFIQK